ncbi:hypothetical protein FRB99_003039 [Tulasnella sp. 403]|nr:hypothetical protein FRB99_003039 [Tulasnella sp. 403]
MKGWEHLDYGDIQAFLREAGAWSTLNHNHLLRFIGVGMLDGHTYLVSPLVANGSIMTYLRREPNAYRLQLLREAADGITYLHSKGIIHGDIKGSNILISDNVQALVCDFGLSKLTNAKTATTREGAGSVRWQAPELWNGAPRSEKTDVYSFGMTIAEVLSGETPFRRYTQISRVILAVMLEGDRPEKSPASSHGVSYQKAWDVAERCWDTEPSGRPNMAHASELLSSA